MKIVIEEGGASLNPKRTGIGRYYLTIKKIVEDLYGEVIIFEKPFLKNDGPIMRKIKYFLWLNTVFLYRLFKLKDDVIVLGVNYYIPTIKIPRVKYVPVIFNLIAQKCFKVLPKQMHF